MPDLVVKAADIYTDFGLVTAYVLAVMFYPTDTNAREAFLDSLQAEAMAQVIETDASITVDQDWALLLYRAQKWAPTKHDAGELVRNGEIAGHLLMLPIFAAVQTGKMRGRGHAEELIRRSHQATRGLSDRRLKDVWSKFGPVSPLWAAMILHPVLTSPADLIEFFALSEGFRETGEIYTPAHGGAPLLAHGEAWRIVMPDACLLPLSINLDLIEIPALAPDLAAPGLLS